MIVTEPRIPTRRERSHRRADRRATAHLDRVTLAVFEAYCFDARMAFERPGEAGGRVLPSRKEDQRHPVVLRRRAHVSRFAAYRLHV